MLRFDKFFAALSARGLALPFEWSKGFRLVVPETSPFRFSWCKIIQRSIDSSGSKCLETSRRQVSLQLHTSLELPPAIAGHETFPMNKEPSDLAKALDVILKSSALEQTNVSTRNAYAT